MQTIYWPAVIKQQHSEELIYLASDRDWLEYCCLQPHMADSLDKLLDSQGITFDIIIDPQLKSEQLQRTSKTPTAELPHLVLSQQPVDLISFIHWVREHATLNGHCCSAKLAFSNIKQGIEAVAYLETI